MNSRPLTAGGDSGPAQINLNREIADLKKQRIFEAAINLFYINGYQQTTLDELAVSLGIKKPVLYSFYGSKSDILTEICAKGIRACLDALELELGNNTGDRRAQIHAIIRSVILATIDNAPAIRIYQREEMNVPADAQASILRDREQFDREIARVIAEGQAENAFPPTVDALFVARQVGAMVSWLPVWFREGRPYSRDYCAQEMANSVLKLCI